MKRSAWRWLMVALLAAAGWGAAGGEAVAADDLMILSVNLDRPTVHALGVQVLISDDDNRNAVVSVRFREVGATSWRDGPPLFRVHPEEVVGWMVPEQLAGSVFDLAPGTTYELELHATDSDGPVDVTMTVMGTTREVPRSDPATPNVVNVSDVAGLTTALGGAQPGDIILLANGTYAGSFFSINASGSADDPIVIRGESMAGVIWDGAGCTGCNILEVYGSYVHIEDMTFENADRAIRFQGAGTTGNVLRRVHIRDVDHGVGSGTDQTDFYVCDNIVEGRLVWPLIYSDDGGANADLQGIRVAGDGHVVCHNTITGFGDPMLNFTAGASSYDFYGNDIYDIYGDGTELDRGARNVRCWGNRWTNAFVAISLQPIHGGPAYVMRNVVVNVVNEQLKLHSLGGTDEPSGVLVYHNTFVSPELALNLQTPVTVHNFILSNNLFVGPASTAAGRTVDWTAVVDEGLFDYDGYYPDGEFWFGVVGGMNQFFNNFASAMAAGVEGSGVLLSVPIFASGLTPPADYTLAVDRTTVDVALDPGSNALDVGVVLPGINAGFAGAGPDLGAVESGCGGAPLFGPRPAGMEFMTNLVDCAAGMPPAGTDAGVESDGGTSGSDGGGPGVDGGGGSDGGDGGGGGGCGCRVSRTTDAQPALVLCFMLALVGLGARRRR